MTVCDYTMYFETVSEAIDGYNLKRLPVKGQAFYAGHRYADDGKKVKIFARKHFGNRAMFTFSEIEA